MSPSLPMGVPFLINHTLQNDCANDSQQSNVPSFRPALRLAFVPPAVLSRPVDGLGQSGLPPDTRMARVGHSQLPSRQSILQMHMEPRQSMYEQASQSHQRYQEPPSQLSSAFPFSTTYGLGISERQGTG